jgi:N-acetylglucosamine-6-phosphate deacetylase
MYATFTKGGGDCQDLSVAGPLLIRPRAVLQREGLVPGLEVLLDGEVVASVGRGLAAADVLDLPDVVLAAGFVDLHVHELGGAGVLDAERPDLPALARALAAGGTTAFLATTAAAPIAELERVLQHVATAQPANPSGARCLGVHLEGPWLAPARAGAQPTAHLAAPAVADLARLLDAGPVRMVTLAPELPGAMELIEYAVSRGVVVALGHSDCDYRTAGAAVDAGARHVTHCFNAMSPLHHREPGLAGAALDLDVSVELIADGEHLHPATARLIHRAVGPSRACLVSDAVDRGARPDGVLAGAAVTQATGVRNLVSWGIPLEHALTMAAATPASVIGHEAVIRPGAPGDLVAVDDAGRLVATWVAGVRT